MTMDRPPRVFISYSHDTPAHEDSVWKLSERLRADGIDANLDQYEDSPPEGWVKWMERQIRESDFVVLICSQAYQNKQQGKVAPSSGLGAKWECALIYQQLYNAGGFNVKFIPVLLENGTTGDIPLPLQAATYYRPCDPVDYERLYCRLRGLRWKEKVALGRLRPAPHKGRLTPSFALSEKLQVVYGSDLFLDDKRIRAALALVYDRIHLLNPPTPMYGCCGLDREFHQHGALHQLLSRLDGLLGQQGLIERKDRHVEIGPDVLFQSPADVYFWMRKHAGEKSPLALAFEKLKKRINEVGLKHNLWSPLGSANSLGPFSGQVMVDYYQQVWAQTSVPRLFLEDTKLLSRTVEDLAFHLHEELLTYFLPDVGQLEDEEILILRKKTEAERLGYRAHILELVDSWSMVQNASDISEMRLFFGIFQDFSGWMEAEKGKLLE